MKTTEQVGGHATPWSTREDAPTADSAASMGEGAPEMTGWTAQADSAWPGWPGTPSDSGEGEGGPGPAGEGDIASAADGAREPEDESLPEASGELEPAVDEATSDEAGDAVPATETTADEPAETPPPQGGRRAGRFVAELTRAMHAAAEEGRAATLDQLRTDSKTAVEAIQADSAEGAAAIRHRSDEDITAIRDWSKAEIARIREETEQKITARKEGLDRELDGHAAVVEAEIENVHTQVTAFETEMDGFFERLATEDDPGRFAALAASMPEPAPFAALSEDAKARIAARAAGLLVEPEETPVPEEVPTPEAGGAPESAAEGTLEAPVQEAAVAEAQAPDAGVAAWGEGTAESGEIDPRLAALGGLTPGAEGETGGATGAPEFAEAERDALAGASAQEAGAQGFSGSSISARLAGLSMPAAAPAPTADVGEVPVMTTQVVVTGLTSVSSIAAFKRQLGRLGGVRSVAVSSGPTGDFVFAVSHEQGLAVADGVRSLGGFGPVVSRDEPGLVAVSAHDPEA